VLACCAESAFGAEKNVLSGAPVTSPISAQGIQLTADNSGKKATIKAGQDDSVIDNRSAGFTSWSVTAEASNDNDDDRVSLFSQDGFRNSTAVGASYMQFSTLGVRGDVARFDELCAKMRNAAAASGKVTSEDATQLACSSANFKLYSPSIASEAEAAQPGPNPGGILWGASAKYANQESTYYSVGDLAKHKDSNRPWNVSVYAGWNPRFDPSQFYLVKVTRKREYEHADKAIKCSFIVNPSDPTCVNGSIGPPTEKKGTAIGFEARKYAIWGKTRVGLSLSVSRDLTAQKTVVDLPIYLIPDNDGVLTGGLGIAWDSKEKKPTVGLFVGSSFNVWPL
jgi:hypothetical protein